LGAAAVVNAGRAEAGPQFQRGHRVARLVPGGPDGRLPRGREAGEAAAVVALPDPLVVHDGLVVVAGDPAQLGPDPGQLALLRWRHARALPPSGSTGPAPGADYRCPVTPMWDCPRCGRAFANRNQTHSCAPLGDLD